MIKYVTLYSLLLLCMSCQSKQPTDLYSTFQEADLHGMVYDLENNAVANLTITFSYIDTYGESQVMVTTDINGRFALSLKHGEHTFVATHKEYLDATGTIVFSRIGQILYIKVKSINQMLNLVAQAIYKEQWQEAKSYLDEIALVNSENILYLFYLASYYYAQGDYHQAVNILEDLSLRSKDPSIAHFLDIIYSKIEDTPSLDNLKKE
jgi:tetratricopeptide (TPR) repeat protein